MADSDSNQWTRIGQGSKQGYSIYRCSCGAEKEVNDKNVRRNQSRSCGCLRIREARERFTTHGMTGTPMYGLWTDIIKRTENPNYKRYADWGGRGIKMCQRWRESFEAFYEDMGDRPEGVQIDRINNDGGYWCGKPECSECGPEERELNCRWVDVKTQQGNKRSVKAYEFRGRTQNLADWAREYKIDYYVLHTRIRNGWSFERALNEPVGENKGRGAKLSEEEVIEIRKRYDKGSRRNGASAIAKEYGVCDATIYRIVSEQN